MKHPAATLLLLVALMAVITWGTASAKHPEIGRSGPDGYSLPAASDAVFSPGGSYLAIQYADHFTLLTTKNIRSALDNPAALPELNGRIIGFLPAGILLYADSGGTYALDPLSGCTTTLFAENIGNYATKRIQSMVIVSNDLLITGDGNADWDGRKVGNIIRFDLNSGSIARGARISAFWYASLSPGGRYILYEHGAEDNNDAEIYDIETDTNYRLSRYFDFPAVFPGHGQTREVPIKWLNARQFIASVDVDGTLSKPNRWLILFDTATRSMLWQIRTEAPVWPNQFELFDDETAYFNYPGKGFYRLSLKNGTVVKMDGMGGDAFAISPDKQTVAFLERDAIILHRFGGSSRQLDANLTGWQPQTAYKGMQRRAPLWSPSGDALILFGEKQLFLIMTDQQANH